MPERVIGSDCSTCLHFDDQHNPDTGECTVENCDCFEFREKLEPAYHWNGRLDPIQNDNSYEDDDNRFAGLNSHGNDIFGRSGW